MLGSMLAARQVEIKSLERQTHVIWKRSCHRDQKPVEEIDNKKKIKRILGNWNKKCNNQLLVINLACAL